MLLRSLQEFGYGGSYGMNKGSLYIGYAIDDSPANKYVAVYPYCPEKNDGEINPLFFPLGKFEIIADDFSKTWATKEITGKPGHTYTSFREFFEINNFWVRLHDWDLEGDDFRVIYKYKKLYEDHYKSLPIIAKYAHQRLPSKHN